MKQIIEEFPAKIFILFSFQVNGETKKKKKQGDMIKLTRKILHSFEKLKSFQEMLCKATFGFIVSVF